MSGRAVMIDSNQGKVLRVVGDTIRVLAGSADTEGSYEIFEVTGPGESGPPLHSHPWSESYIVLDGEVEVTVGDSTKTMTKGGFVNIPAEMPHTYKIVSDSARFNVITTPSGAGDFFEEMDRVTSGSMNDMEKVVQVAVSHGLKVGGAC